MLPSFACGRKLGPPSEIVMKYLIWSLLAAATLLAAQGKQTFVGTITDDECTTADHSRMRMGSTDAQCARACVEVHGGSSFCLAAMKSIG